MKYVKMINLNPQDKKWTYVGVPNNKAEDMVDDRLVRFTTKQRYKKELKKDIPIIEYSYPYNKPTAKDPICKYCGRKVKYGKMCKICETNHRIKQIKHRRKHA